MAPDEPLTCQIVISPNGDTAASSGPGDEFYHACGSVGAALSFWEGFGIKRSEFYLDPNQPDGTLIVWFTESRARAMRNRSEGSESGQS